MWVRWYWYCFLEHHSLLNEESCRRCYDKLKHDIIAINIVSASRNDQVDIFECEDVYPDKHFCSQIVHYKDLPSEQGLYRSDIILIMLWYVYVKINIFGCSVLVRFNVTNDKRWVLLENLVLRQLSLQEDAINESYRTFSIPVDEFCYCSGAQLYYYTKIIVES